LTASALILRTLGESPSGRRRFELLQAIAATGSIVQAAKAVGMSYKGAWDAVEALNNGADEALVHRVAGGKRGGGTQLTERGRELLALYEKLREEQQGMVSRIEREHAHASRDLPVLGRLSMLSSARNQLAGRVVEIQTGSVNDQIAIELPGGSRVIATITGESTKLLQLKRGTPLTALIKAPWIMLAAAGMPLACSAANQLQGVVRRIKPGAVNAEVVLELPGGQTLAAIITQDSVASLGLKKGQPATALFNASSVILVRLD
jgi:molybdate transport system regulatory protein